MTSGKVVCSKCHSITLEDGTCQTCRIEFLEKEVERLKRGGKSLIEEYYERDENPPTNPIKEIAFIILENVTDRRGWRQEWDEIAEEIKEEILETWIRKIGTCRFLQEVENG